MSFKGGPVIFTFGLPGGGSLPCTTSVTPLGINILCCSLLKQTRVANLFFPKNARPCPKKTEKAR